MRGAPMVIVDGHVTVEPQQRESYLAACISIVEQGPRHSRRLDLAVTAALIDPRPRQRVRALGIASGAGGLSQQRRSAARPSMSPGSQRGRHLDANTSGGICAGVFRAGWNA